MPLTKLKLSGSTDGKPIPVAGTATGSATTIHTAHASALDELWLWVTNVTAAEATLTIEWGSTSDPGGHLCKAVPIPPNSGPMEIAPGLPLTNSAVVKAFSGTASALNIHGYVIRPS